MNLTNKHGLPDAIFRAVQGYDRDYENTHKRRSDISATTLLNPPQAVQLNRLHFKEIEEDASDRLWALLGQAVHAILAKAETSALTEQRLYMEIGGWTLSGQYDRLTLLPTGHLQDYKVCSVWEVIYGLKAEREQQLNVLAELCAANGHAVTSLEIVCILRDWQKAKAAENDHEYPQAGFARIAVPLWPQLKRRAFIEARVRLHQQARNGVIAQCTDEDRWYSGEQFAVMKKGRKSAVRLHEARESADKMAADLGAGHTVEHRRGVNKRCESYCRVAPFCPQWLAMNNAAIEAARAKSRGATEATMTTAQRAASDGGQTETAVDLLGAA